MQEALNELGWLLPTILLLLGLCVGSFLNVVIYRLPLMLETSWRRDCCELLEIEGEKEDALLTLAAPNSHCPHCKAPIQPQHNIPVLSYLLLRGKCANCAAPISLRYPSIELVTGLMSLLLMWYFAPDWSLVGALLFTWALIALTMIDFDQKLLPDNITLPLLWLGLLLNISGTYTDLSSAVIGAVAGYGILWSIYWLFKLVTGKEGMGYGDFKLLAALGAWMGWQALHMIILMSSVVGIVAFLVLMVFKKQNRDTPIPFGPFLAAAGWITFLWGDKLLVHLPFLNVWTY